MNYAELHAHTMYSKLDATNRPNAMLGRVAELGQTHLATTDHGNMYAFAEMFKTSEDKFGITVIPGCEFYVAARGMDDKSERDTYHLTVFALDAQGYKNLCALHYESFKRGFYYDPRIDLDLLAKHSAGLFALSGCLGGALPKAIKKGQLDVAHQRLVSLRQIFGDRFRIELQDHGIAEQSSVNVELRSMSKQYGIPMVATNDSHYTRHEDHVDHDIVICLGTGKNVDSQDRQKIYLPWGEYRLKSADEMAKRFEPAVIEESSRIAQMFEPFDLFKDKGSFHIPFYCEKPEDELREKVWAGIAERYLLEPGSEHTGQLKARTDYELDMICKSGFASYMLIVADLYDFMRREQIPVGAGRGSAAGSIVSYALGITKLDPLRFGLLFERFINPERVSMPDIDMDISKVRREEVIEYAKRRWGEENVARIISFQTFGGRRGIRDVGRVLNVPLQTTDRLAKLVPINGSLTTDKEKRHYLKDAIELISGLKNAYEGDDLKVRKMLDSAMHLEGCVTTPSIHAAGVVISDRPLQKYLPMSYLRDTKDRWTLVTGCDMNYLEEQAQIKFDFLGLDTLDVVDNAIRAAKTDGVMPPDFQVDDIPYDDDKTYRMLSRGLTAGVFQLESTGMRQWLRQLKPDRVEDVMAMVALYRPGPMEEIPRFVKRKSGEEPVSYPHPSLEETLHETYGVVVYQEQIQKIAQIIAGWSLGRADMLRKVIGKKIIEKIEGEKEQFVIDAVKQGHEEAWARELFVRTIEPAARYSFNKSHACAYGDLSYKTAWLKANYPTYFYAALISALSKSNKKDKAAKMMAYIADARSFGVAVLPPDIHESGLDFTPIQHRKAVRFGLLAIKNVGTKAIDLMLEARDAGGDFTDLFDFMARSQDTLVNARTVKSLILAGAFDELPGTRAQKVASIEIGTKRNKEFAEDAKRIREGKPPKRRQKPIPDAILVDAEMSEDEMLGAEHDLLGIYVSGHPFMRYAAIAEAKTTSTLSNVREMSDGHHGTIAGIVSAVREHSTRNGGKSMLFATIEDDQVTIEVTVFPKTYSEQRDLFQLGKMIVLKGRADVNEVEAQEDDDDLGEAGAVEVKWISDSASSIEAAPFVKSYDPNAVREVTTVGVRNDLVSRDTLTDFESVSTQPFRQTFELTTRNYVDVIARLKREHGIQSGDVEVKLPGGETYIIVAQPPFVIPEYY